MTWPSPAIADLDSDGDYDLLLGSYTEGYCAAWENTGNVTAPAWTRKPEWDLTGLPENNNKHPELVDLDSDGDYDLMVGVSAPVSNITAYMNTGTPMNPQWTRYPLWDIPLPNMLWIRPAFANLDGVHDISVFDFTTSKTVVGQGYTMQINVTLTNRGDHPERVNAFFYVKDPWEFDLYLYNITIELTPRQTITITFTWNTAGFAKGKYTIWAYAWPVPGKTDTSDNTLSNGIVYVGIPGDINGDGIVDIYDALKLAAAFGSKPNNPHWNPNADINNDLTTDIYDALKLAANFGKQDP